MLKTLNQLDQSLFLWLNDLNAAWLDPIMLFITGKFGSIPLYVVILVFLIYKFKKDSIFILLGIGLTILLADQFASGFCKPFFERLRPCHNLEIESLVHLVKGCGGQFGFISSHAANTFGLATFLWILLRKDYNWIKYMFLWAAVVSYSRIYVGVHYPADILLGGFAGAICGYLAFHFYKRIQKAFS